MALKLMNEGEVAEVIVNPRFAYGELGVKDPTEQDPVIRTVPPNATITYTVELVSMREESDIEARTYASRKEIGNRKRLRGNFWMKRQEYNLAIQSYRRALEYLDDTVSAGGMMESGSAGSVEVRQGRRESRNKKCIVRSCFPLIAKCPHVLEGGATNFSTRVFLISCPPRSCKICWKIV